MIFSYKIKILAFSIHIRKYYIYILTSLKNRTAVNGKLKEQKSKSEMHNDRTNAVVGWFLILGDFIKARIVTEFPEKYVKNIVTT